MSAVTPEAREQAIDLLSSIYPMDVHDSFGRAAVDALIELGWSPPVTPEATELDPFPWRDLDANPRRSAHERYWDEFAPRRIFDQDRSHYPEGGKP
jgi:hypothetical protein